MLVTADSLAQGWTGKLDDNIAESKRLTGCFDVRCYPLFDVISDPESDIVSFVFKGPVISVNLTMHRDPQAQLEEPLQLLMIR